MKITVKRELIGGIYWVSFRMSDFTPEELRKMQSFGVPNVPLRQGIAPAQPVLAIAINQVSEQHKAGFRAQQEANAYEEQIVNHVREAMKSLRERQDNFTSIGEVNI